MPLRGMCVLGQGAQKSRLSWFLQPVPPRPHGRGRLPLPGWQSLSPTLPWAHPGLVQESSQGDGAGPLAMEDPVYWGQDVQVANDPP